MGYFCLFSLPIFISLLMEIFVILKYTGLEISALNCNMSLLLTSVLCVSVCVVRFPLPL